jgi:hypothetical protein
VTCRLHLYRRLRTAETCARVTCVLCLLRQRWDVYSPLTGDVWVAFVSSSENHQDMRVTWRSISIFHVTRMTIVAFFCRHPICDILYAGLVIMANFRYQATWTKNIYQRCIRLYVVICGPNPSAFSIITQIIVCWLIIPNWFPLQ